MLIAQHKHANEKWIREWETKKRWENYGILSNLVHEFFNSFHFVFNVITYFFVLSLARNGCKFDFVFFVSPWMDVRVLAMRVTIPFKINVMYWCLCMETCMIIIDWINWIEQFACESRYIWKSKRVRFCSISSNYIVFHAKNAGTLRWVWNSFTTLSSYHKINARKYFLASNFIIYFIKCCWY